MAAPQLPAAGGPLAYVGTFLVTALFYTVTAHIAARYVVGDVPVARAGLVGGGLAAVSFLLRPFGAILVLASTLAVDVALMRVVYRGAWRSTAILVVVHYAVSVILGLVLINLVTIATAVPG